MWTGDVHSGYSSQWALNPSAYQHLPNEQVDWATLAQQWIKMKETFPVDQVPPAPPPPSIKNDIEAGEAPMDMSKDEPAPSTTAGTPQDGISWGSWNNWQQWGWNWSGGTHGGGTGPPMPAEKPAAAPPYTFSANNTSSYPATDTPTTFDYNHGVSTSDSFDQQEYWHSDQAPYVRNKSSGWKEASREPVSRKPVPKIEEVEPDTTALFDAAKRKQLPAWIREGLEKMEREKQKKIDRERQLQEREEELLRRKKEEEEALASGIPLKSKFDTSDSEESEKETAEEEVPINKPRKSRFDATITSPAMPVVTKPSPPPQPPVKRKSREEIMQEVMQQMRFVLTNILMTVTNEEMQKIAEEVHADFRIKAPATQLRKTPAFTSLTGKLGLGIYDTESEESAESDSEPAHKKENGVDSDEELKERIYRKRQEFARIERDIEHQVELQEERERERERRARESEEEEEEESPPTYEDKGQVEPKHTHAGIRPDVKVEEPKNVLNPTKLEENHTESFTPERPHKTEIESSEEHTEDSDNSSSKSDSSSRSSSSSRYRKSRKSSKKRKEKKSGKKKRKRSSSRGSDRKRSSHKKSSHRYEERHRYERSRSRSRSRSRGRYEEYRRKRRHSSESSHHRSESSYHRHSNQHSYSRSPEYSRGKRSSHRSHD